VKEKDKVNKDKIDQAFHFLEDEKKHQHNYRKNRDIKNKENEYYENIMYFEKYKQKSNKKENWRKNNLKKAYQKDGYNKNQPYQPKITKMHHKIEEIVDYLDNEDLCPAVIFVFSIKKITEYAKMLSLKNLVPLHQQKEISDFYESVVNSMPLEDRRIPQVQELREILQSGIGMHHAGLLPILKETIEVLYSRGLIKILKQMKSKLKIALNISSKKNKNILKRKMKFIMIQMNMILINYVSQKCIIN
jgi:antiviral helicase SKI2